MPTKTETYYTRVAGVSFRQDIAKLAKRNDQCNLVPEPNNPHDQNAIMIMLTKENKQLGYIPREHNEAIGLAIASNLPIRTSIESIGTAGSSDNIGIQLRIEVDFPLF